MQHNYMIMHIAKIGNQGLNPDSGMLGVIKGPGVSDKCKAHVKSTHVEYKRKNTYLMKIQSQV